MTKTVLILGASGRFGAAAAEAFWNAGWQVRPFRRGDDLTAAARGATLIVNGWNPPYPRWASDLPGQTQQVIVAARASGARVLIPGNIYVYGAEAPELLTPSTPHTATNALGKLRRDMERMYREAGVPTIILRAGDYLDTRASGNWFDKVIAKEAQHGKIVYPGDPDAPHAWAFLPDLAAAAITLAERTDLPTFEDVTYPGFTLTGRQMAAAVAMATGRPQRLARFRWWPLHLLAPVWGMARSLLEMRYLWSKPHRLDGTRFAALAPGHVPTPIPAAMQLALAHKVHPDQTVPRGNIAPVTGAAVTAE